MEGQIHHLSQRLIFLSGDVEKNPGPSNNFNNVNSGAPAARTAAKWSPIGIMGKKRKPMS